MTWARLDDTFHHHPKGHEVTLAALGLFALGLSYSADNGTRGRLPEKWVLGRIIGDDQTAPQQLVDAGLWERVDSGWVIHDYHDYNLTPEELEERRVGARERKRRQRDRERESRVTESVSPGPGSGSGSAAEFGDWLEHYRQTTGKTSVRGSQSARDAFAARRKEGRTLVELKAATVGCHGDEFCREHGHDVPETILRASKVERYIQLAAHPVRPSADRTAPQLRRLEDERQRLLAEERPAA
jgi:hypothetical protein